MRARGPAVLVVRSDNVGDVLLAGPAIRAVAQRASVTVMCGPRGRAAAELLPCVDRIVEQDLPWISPGSDAAAITDDWVERLVARLSDLHVDEAIVLTSFHQSSLPLALLLRAAGIPRITAISEDFPGALLDVRVPHVEGEHEVDRALRTVEAAGYPLPADDDGRLALRGDVTPGIPRTGRIVVHPGASVPARALPLSLARDVVQLLARAGADVVVTGTAEERQATAFAAGDCGRDLGGLTDDLGDMARLLAGAAAVVVGNTGVAHLAAAVGTPVVSVFAPVVPWESWRPHGVPVTRFGEPDAACAGSRARECPVPGHPCVTSIHPEPVASVALSHLVEVPPSPMPVRPAAALVHSVHEEAAWTPVHSTS